MSDLLTPDQMKTLLSEQHEKIITLEKRIAAAEKQAEAAEQYSRQDCLILRGRLDVRPNLSLRDEVMRLIAYHTGVRFPSWCLNTVHWLGGGSSLIVRFNNKAVRDEVYRSRIPKEAEKRGLFIHESLTPSKMALVSKCAVMRKQGSIMTYYTQGGNVMVKKARDTPSMMVTPGMSEQDILEMLQKQPVNYREAVRRETKAGEQAARELASTRTTRVGGKGEESGQKHQKDSTERKETTDETEEVQKSTAEPKVAPSTSEKDMQDTQKTQTSSVRPEGEKEEVVADVTPVENEREKQKNEQNKKDKTTDRNKDGKGEALGAVSEVLETSDAANLHREDSSTEVSESPSKSPSKQRKSKRRRNQQKGKKL